MPEVEPLLNKSAIQGRAGIAAPLLAGFSLALVGVIAQDPTHFRWPGATLAALMIPIFCLLYAARVGARVQGIDVDSYNYDAYKKLSRRTSLIFGIGICSLWACIAMAAAPPLSGGQETEFRRWVAFGLAIAASIVEAGWTFKVASPWQGSNEGIARDQSDTTPLTRPPLSWRTTGR